MSAQHRIVSVLIIISIKYSLKVVECWEEQS